jgi:UDP-3-O-[3-hydroxymyristoyl] N-acetylglucosamine deacetylase
MLKQRTLKQPISATGVGLHSGEKVTLTLKPAPADHGVVFQRIDLPDTPAMRVAPTAVNDTRLSSALEFSGARVATVEHLMSALAGLGVDNVLIELTAAEVPIMDGSSGPFIYLLQTAGLQELDAAKKFVRILKPIEVQEGDKWAKFTPHHGFKAEFTIDFAHPVFEFSGKTVTIDYDSQSYVDEISRARTFGFMHEVEYLRANGLAKGGSLDNAIVLDEYKVLNGGGLRYDDEFAKHKVLDAIGDLYILGYPIIGQFTAFKSGHALNNQLLRALLADDAAWEYCTFDNDAHAPVGFIKQRDYFSPAPLLPA